MRSMVLAVHGLAGALALSSGLVAALSAKGGRVHRRAGQLYVGAMAVACVTALVLVGFFRAGPFLGPVAVLSFYAAFSGWRVIRRPAGQAPEGVDRIAGALTVLSGLALIAQGVNHAQRPVLLVLGGIAVLLGARGLRAGPLDAAGRRVQHLRSMGAAYIATVSAFSAVNLLFLPVTLRWLWPAALGSVALVFWSRAERRRAEQRLASRRGVSAPGAVDRS